MAHTQPPTRIRPKYNCTMEKEWAELENKLTQTINNPAENYKTTKGKEVIKKHIKLHLCGHGEYYQNLKNS